jgi:hypothetical protein
VVQQGEERVRVEDDGADLTEEFRLGEAHVARARELVDDGTAARAIEVRQRASRSRP